MTRYRRFLATAALCLLPLAAHATTYLQAGPLLPAVVPRGRLTLQSSTPVQTSDQTAKSTVYYDCYAGNLVPWFNGKVVGTDAIGSCQVSTTMQTSGSGVTNSAGVFDIWWNHANTGICVATNGSGGGWASDTSGSNTARGTGYSKVDQTSFPFVTNGASVADCYNGSTNYCATACAANTLTYLGTLYTTAAGQTGMAEQAAAASGGSAPVLGLWNAYNQVMTNAVDADSGVAWAAHTGATAEPLDNSTSNRVTWVDGLARSAATCTTEISSVSIGTGFYASAWCSQNSTTSTPSSVGIQYVGSNNSSSITSIVVFYPSIGINYAQFMEVLSSTSTSQSEFKPTSGGLLQLPM